MGRLPGRAAAGSPPKGEPSMADNVTAVFGIYSSASQAQRAVDELIEAGFASSNISVLLPDVHNIKAFAHEAIAHEKSSKAPEGTAVGVTTGGVIGGTLGVLAGVGMLAIPGVGPLIAAGPIMTGLAGLGVGGAVGGLVGALVGIGIPEYAARRYEGHVKAGATLLSVHCDEISRAKHILKGTGAEEIASTTETSPHKETAVSP
jgi:hypothetical protein